MYKKKAEQTKNKKDEAKLYKTSQVVLKSSVKKTGACNRCGYIFSQGENEVRGVMVHTEGATRKILACPKCGHAYGIFCTEGGALIEKCTIIQ